MEKATCEFLQYNFSAPSRNNIYWHEYNLDVHFNTCLSQGGKLMAEVIAMSVAVGCMASLKHVTKKIARVYCRK